MGLGDHRVCLVRSNHGSGFWFPSGQTELIVNTDGTVLSTDDVEVQLADVSGGVSVSATVADDEPALLEAMQRVLFDRFDAQYNRLVALNAEAWKSGFDLPFLRTCFIHDFSWLFDGLQFADLWDPLKKRMNTTYTVQGNSNSVNSLTGAHELLFSHPPTDLISNSDHPWYCNTQYDPFEDSEYVVGCHRRNEFLPILQHNLADVHRTWELAELVRAFVSPKDITTKKL